jgi:CHASE2 domain-containing sensor protein
VTGRRRFAALVLVALAACGLALAVRESGALAPLEREALKARFNVRGTEPVDGLRVVGIDAKSFQDLDEGWPFKRSVHGQVVRRLHAAGARLIV